MNKILPALLFFRSRFVGVLLVLAAGALCGPARADYIQVNLVSSIPGLATITDPLLVNSWGISRSPTSPFWTSNQGTNTSTLFAVTGATNVSKVTSVNANGFVAIPTTSSGAQGPTGQVNNTNTSSFQLVPGVTSTSSRFIFANLNGTISGWAGAGALSSSIQVSTPGALYTGLAINTAGTRLYAANGASAGIDIFDSSFASVSLPGAFTDPNLPSGFVPFNVQNIGGKVYVTYALVGLPAQRAATPGQGFVNVFDENGVFLQRLISGSELASPWGIALAPAGFGEFAGDLLVGNFSFAQSEINAFDLVTGAFQGTIPISAGAGNTAGGLWGLSFGSGAGNGGNSNTLYFADGINGETAGLFGAILAVAPAAVPEPAMLGLLFLGLGLLGFARLRSKWGSESHFGMARRQTPKILL